MVECCCSSLLKMESTSPTMVPTFARLSTKSMAASSGPAIPRERIVAVMKVSAGRLPARYISHPAGRTVISVVGARAREMETGSWQLFIQW